MAMGKMSNDGDKMSEADECDEEKNCVQMNDEDNEILGMPPEVLKAAANVRNDLLPNKSRLKYNIVYNNFMEWKKVKKVSANSENVMLAYFGELAKKYSPPTLWATYSMLRSTMIINQNVNLHNYKQLIAFLKKNSSGYRAKKSKVFTASEMNTFLEEAPDGKYLTTKVVLIFGIMGACRGAELTNLTVNDVMDRDDVLIIKLRDTKNKTTRSFTIEGEFLKIVKKYQALRLPRTTSDRFFMNYRDGYCTNQVIGKNKLGGMPKEIAQFLKLPDPEAYTGHSFRRSSATLVADEGGDITEIKRLGGWKSTTVAEGYIEDSVGYKRKTGKQISTAIMSSSNKYQRVENADKENTKVSTSTIVVHEAPDETITTPKEETKMHFVNCSNITINFSS